MCIPVIRALKYGGASSWRHLNTRDTILNSIILSGIGSQWRSIFALVTLALYSFKFRIIVSPPSFVSSGVSKLALMADYRGGSLCNQDVTL